VSPRRSTSAPASGGASTLQDLRECTSLLDELPELDLMATQVSAGDVPLDRRELVEYFTVLTETRRHVNFIDCPSEVDAVLRICEVLSGDLDRFRERPRISTIVTAASPLQVEGPPLDVHAALAGHGVPVKVYSMAIAGATSPVTPAGTVAQGWPSSSASRPPCRSAAPGARLIFCFGSGVLDMRRTTFSLGCVESALMAVMATEVGHFLGVPTMNPALSTDSKHPGLQTGYEKALKASTSARRTPTSSRAGACIDSHNTMYLPQSVVDNEIAAMVRRLRGEPSRSRRRRWPASRSAGSGPAAASSARRTRPVASAPASTCCRPSPTATPTRSGSSAARPSSTWPAPRSSASSPSTRRESPYLDDDQLDELAVDLPRRPREPAPRTP
jgi:trimethylamine:corrinoid methyltransferase-like protein